MIRHLTPHIDEADRVDIAVSFVMESGVRLLRPHLQDLLDRGGALRLITGEYLDVTDPEALRRLMDLEGRAELKVFEAGVIGFHPKSWIFHFADGSRRGAGRQFEPLGSRAEDRRRMELSHRLRPTSRAAGVTCWRVSRR